MFRFSTHFGPMLARSLVALFAAADVEVSEAEQFPVNIGATNLIANSIHWVTNVSQFRTLSSADFLAGCDFQLTGVITLVDTNRDLVVLQDDTGAVALNFCMGDQVLKVGQSVTLDGTNACPLFASFPDYPYRPSGQDICSSFESPMNWGEYNLTRMQGFLHPMVSGNYRFWIASDNSSELWLSTDATLLNARRIASVPRLNWTDPHQWTKFPSQRSETIWLNAGETYYIEALQEQTRADEHLSVGWQIPAPGNPEISVIDGRYLTPLNGVQRSAEAVSKGILREYWTNYTAGSVEHMAGERPFESALTVERVSLQLHGPGQLPKPERITLSEPLTAASNYRWVVLEGVAKFTAAEGNVAFLEVFDGKERVQVRASHWNREKFCQLEQLTNATVRVEGVCEGVFDPKGTMMPGLIWAPAEDSVSFIDVGTSNGFTLADNQLNSTTVLSNPTISGYFETFGVVTFNDRVFDKDYVFMQEDSSALQVSLDSSLLKNELKVGRCVGLGGQLSAGKYLQVVTPFFVIESPPQPMPLPLAYFPGGVAPPNLEGRWTELEGVVHSLNTNGTLSFVGKDGAGYLWLGQTSSNDLAHFVDARLRARGVLMRTMLDAPLLLVPSRDFVDVEEESPIDTFGTRPHLIADVLSEAKEPLSPHRVRVIGEVTYSDAESFFVQDASGGIRVLTPNMPAVTLGEAVDVAAFPMRGTSKRVLTDAVVRPATAVEDIKPRDLDLDAAPFSRQCGTLVQISATLLDRKNIGMNQMMELEEKQRVVTATLTADQGNLPMIAAGSRLLVSGVREDGITASPETSLKSPSAQFLAPVNILMRKPGDVIVLSGPAWWTWRKTATLIGMLLATLTAALLWIYLLRRRLERHRAAQLASSQLILGKLEEERRRIAINLHDSLGQTLLVIKHRSVCQAEGQGTQNILDEIANIASQAIDEVRRITHGLRPSQLDHLGLTQAIRALVARASEKDTILIASRVENIDGVFDKDAEIHVYRVVQEAITNVVKHSAATEATVVIKKQPATVSISIRDNGRGFDPAKLSSQTHDLGYGLGGIKERVRILKGTVVIDSKPSTGTSLTVEVPFKIS
jgi:signal transduction histidine kinase